ncbi:MAG: ABC transporter ATP-binding protein [Candidatus Pacebacteria bacterium]|nr:ABC transporter ATP-binding protein [Candidatus Paceibacterota bacterium]
MIRTEKLSKDYGNNRGVFDLSLNVPKGHIYGFIGPNGAGKTTTIKVLCGLLRPTAGKAYINDIEVRPRHVRQIKKLIGYMPDSFGVYQQMSVWEYLDFFCAAYRIPTKQRRKRVDEALKLAEASYMLDYQMGSLSHGMNKRVALARILLHDPQVLIMDEPANGLDPHGRIEMRKMIQRLRDYGKTILLSSHILPELSSVCDQVGIIEKGRLLANGTVKDITSSLRKQMVLSIMIQSDAATAASLCKDFPNVKEVNTSGNELRVVFAGTRNEIAELNETLVHQGVRIIGLREEQDDLEEAFLKVTGRHDGEAS